MFTFVISWLGQLIVIEHAGPLFHRFLISWALNIIGDHVQVQKKGKVNPGGAR